MKVLALLLVTLASAFGALGQEVVPPPAKPDYPHFPSPQILMLVQSWPDELSNTETPTISADAIVAFDISVNENGNLQEYHRLSGPEALSGYAEDYLLHVRFNTPVLEGKSSGFRSELGICFSREFAKDVVPCTVAGTGEQIAASTLFLDGKEANKRLAHRDPGFSAATKTATIGGPAIFRVLVGLDGAVADVKTVTGSSPQLKAVEEAIRRSTYKPFLFMGKPVRAYFFEKLGGK